MDDPRPPIVTSTARRPRRPRPRSLEIAIAASALVAVVVVLTHHESGSPERPVVDVTTAAPTATLRPSPTSTPPPPSPAEERGPWVVAEAPTLSPTSTVPRVEPVTRRRAPTPTPAVPECLAARWSAGQSAAAWGQVLVTIDVVNRCGRILEPTEMGFWIAGYRRGDLVQTASGHAFQRLYPDRSETVIIGLPGSIDWYDRITVTVME